MTRKPLLLVPLALCLLALAACSEAKLALHVAKKINFEAKQGQPPPKTARSEYKLGSPYQIDHVWYYPSYEPYYSRTGIASWYGPSFHGRPTANGERFDMNEVSAAHPTLPLPSRVRVTNLENGRQLVLRVNDRGPFVDGRLIDLSRRAAQLLGFYRKGLAKVRVEYLGLDRLRPDVPLPADAPIMIAGTPPVAFKPRQPESPDTTTGLPPAKPVHTASESPPQKRQTAGRTSSASPGLLVEAAVVEGRDAADRLGDRVRTLGDVAVDLERRGDRLVYAVRIGPVDTDDEAASILARLERAGLTESHIIAADYR